MQSPATNCEAGISTEFGGEILRFDIDIQDTQILSAPRVNDSS
jgi:hypothetical protein